MFGTAKIEIHSSVLAVRVSSAAIEDVAGPGLIRVREYAAIRRRDMPHYLAIAGYGLAAEAAFSPGPGVGGTIDTVTVPALRSM